MKHLAKIFCIAALGAFATWNTAAGAATGTVSGLVLNKTTGQGAVGITVKLVKPGKSSDSLVAQTKSRADGSYSFGPFKVGDTDIFMAQVEWQGQRYETVAYDGTGRLKEMTGVSVDPKNVGLTIFNTTREAPALTFQVHHLAIESAEREMKCTERIVVDNLSNSTYIGDAKTGATVKLFVPPSAKDVTLDPKVGGKLLKTADGYAFAKPLTPKSYGRRNAIIFTYTVPWPPSAPWDRKLDMSREIIYPTNFFFVARNEGDKDLKVVAPQLGPDQTQEIPSEEGQPLVKIVNAVGRPMSESPALSSKARVSISLERPVSSTAWGFMFFILALTLIVPMVLLAGRRSSGKIGEPSGGGVVLGESLRLSNGGASDSGAGLGSQIATGGEAQKLIFEIARLDEEFQNGAIAAKEYQQRRAVWKKQLMERIAQQGEDA